METLLSFGDTSTRGHEDTVEEIRMTVVEFATDLSERSGEECTESLFFSSRHVSEDANVLGKDIFTSTEDSHGILLSRRQTRSVRRDIVRCHFFEFRENAADLQALFEVVVLVGIDKLDVFSTIEDEGVVLIVGLAVTKDRVTR